MRYPYVLFDWDGCLAATLEPWIRSIRFGLDRRGLTADDRAIASQFAEWDLTRLGVPEHLGEVFLAEIIEIYTTELPGVQLYPGAGELVRELSGLGVRLALVTSSVRDALDPVLGPTGLEPYFDAMVCSEDTVEHKPHPEAVLRALELLGGSTSDAVLVGDSARDLGAARNAGVDSILVYPEAHRLFYELADLRVLEPTHVCESFDEVRGVLLREHAVRPTIS